MKPEERGWSLAHPTDAITAFPVLTVHAAALESLTYATAFAVASIPLDTPVPMAENPFLIALAERFVLLIMPFGGIFVFVLLKMLEMSYCYSCTISSFLAFQSPSISTMAQSSSSMVSLSITGDICGGGVVSLSTTSAVLLVRLVCSF